MAVIYANLQGGTITDNPLLVGATTISSAAFATLPEVVAPDVMYLTLDPTGVAGAPEIVQVTAHTAAATSATIVRARQSTTAREHLAATIWLHALTKADIDEFLKEVPEDSVDSVHYVDGSIDTVHLADDAVTADKIDATVATAASVTAVDTKYESLTIFSRSTDEALTASDSYEVVWETETSDPDGWGATGAAALTCPETGLYILSGGVVGTGASFTAYLRIDGDTEMALHGSFFGQSIIRYLTAGQVITVTAETGAAVGNLDSATIYFARLR